MPLLCKCANKFTVQNPQMFVSGKVAVWSHGSSTTDLRSWSLVPMMKSHLFTFLWPVNYLIAFLFDFSPLVFEKNKNYAICFCCYISETICYMSVRETLFTIHLYCRYTQWCDILTIIYSYFLLRLLALVIIICILCNANSCSYKWWLWLVNTFRFSG